jgi:DNA polymerase III epsilon subunit family exonuclease
VQLAFDAVDRLVELLEERGRPVPAAEAARHLLALKQPPDGLARALIDELVAGDSRVAWRGNAVALAEGAADPLLEEASFVVVDLETTGLSAASARICEIGAVRVERLELTARFETLVRPGVPLPPPIERLTGLRDRELRHAPRVDTAVRSFAVFAGDDLLVAHNARFDMSFLDRAFERATGRRTAAPALDTVALARRLLEGRVARTGLASLSFFFGTQARPCHRALPDAEATAEILVGLIGLAQERGARTLSDLEALAAPRKRRVHGKRSLARGAPSRPGVYLFRDRHDRVLYVGKARDLEARLRSYFRSDRQRPAVEAALGAVERIEWRVTGSELEAALDELRLIRELRPAANARRSAPERYLYLRARGADVVVSKLPSALGPIRSRRKAELAARALRDHGLDGLDGTAAAALRARMADLADCLRYEDAGRVRDRLDALEEVAAHLGRLDRLRRARLCLVVPGLEAGWSRALLVAGGRVCARRDLPPGGGAVLEVEAGLAAARRSLADPSIEPEDADELLAVAPFLRRPPPELRICALDAAAITGAGT